MNNLKICLVGPEKFYPAYDSLLLILKKILWSGQVTEIRTKSWMMTKVPSILKPLLYLSQDLMLYLKILTYYKKLRVNVILIYQGYYPLTCIGLSILNLKLLLYIGGSSFETSYYENLSFIGKLMAFSNIPIQKICHEVADLIILPAERMVKLLNLYKYSQKIRTALCIITPRFLKEFTILNDYTKPRTVIGYVGNLSKSKGILNLFHSIHLIANKLEDGSPKFVLVGSGPLKYYLENMICNSQFSKNVAFAGYVPHKDLSKYYNEMKLLVLPSYTEGLPSVILEAMACGTPVLAAPVGAIPDIIKDGETGFLLESNDPKHIASKIIELLSKPELLEKVSINAYNYVRENFSYEKTLEAWRRILSELKSDK